MILVVLMQTLQVMVSKATSTLIRFRLKTHTLRIPWPTKIEAFENTDVMNSIISLPRRTETYRFLIASVDGWKRFENASVDADICIRFRLIKNGGIRKRISVDVA